MPNTGKPSQDCHLCRSRRVKCDLARPQCQRCIRYGVACPGYRDMQQLVFRQVNPITSEKKRQYQRQHEQYQRRKNAGEIRNASLPSPEHSSPETHLSPSGSSSSSSSSLDSDDPSSPVSPLPPSLTPHWTSQSIPIVLNMYPGIRIIQNCYRQCEIDGPLVWVAHLLARTYVINMKYPTCIDSESASESKKELGTYFGKSLSAVSRILKQPDGSMRDDVLATIWLLANYELLIGSLDPDGPVSPWNMHLQGMYGLLKSRPLSQFMDPKWRIVSFWPAYNLVQVQSIITTTECPAETSEWLRLARKTRIPQECQLIATAAFVERMTRLAAGIVYVIRTYAFEDAASSYHEWVAELADAQLGVEEDLSLATPGAEPTGLRHSMMSIRNAAIIKTCHLFTLLVEFLSHWPKCPIPADKMSTQSDSCVLACRRAAGEVINSMPEILGPLDPHRTDKSPRMLFDAVRMIWPLISVCETPSTLPGQRRQAEEALAYMASEMGVRQARVKVSLSWVSLESCRTTDLLMKAVRK